MCIVTYVLEWPAVGNDGPGEWRGFFRSYIGLGCSRDTISCCHVEHRTYLDMHLWRHHNQNVGFERRALWSVYINEVCTGKSKHCRSAVAEKRVVQQHRGGDFLAFQKRVNRTLKATSKNTIDNIIASMSKRLDILIANGRRRLKYCIFMHW